VRVAGEVRLRPLAGTRGPSRRSSTYCSSWQSLGGCRAVFVGALLPCTHTLLPLGLVRARCCLWGTHCCLWGTCAHAAALHTHCCRWGTHCCLLHTLLPLGHLRARCCLLHTLLPLGHLRARCLAHALLPVGLVRARTVNGLLPLSTACCHCQRLVATVNGSLPLSTALATSRWQWQQCAGVLGSNTPQ
jgi:hypothetical protein